MPELEIKLHPTWRKRQCILFVATTALTLAFLYVISYNLFQDPIMGTMNVMILLTLMLQSLYRVRYLKALYIRADDTGIRWRLIAEMEILQRLRPPISEAKLAWQNITHVRNMATGMYFTVRGEEKERYLPMSNFSYAQRREIKHAIASRIDASNEERR